MIMNVQEYIKKRKQEILEEKEKSKKQLLINLGLFKKQFAPTPQSSSADYPYFDYSKQNAYRVEVAAVSDEEFEELLKVIPSSKAVSSSNMSCDRNSKALSIIGTLLIVLGIIFCVALLITGIVFVCDYDDWAWCLIVSSVVLLPFNVGLGYLFKVVADVSRSVCNVKS